MERAPLSPSATASLAGTSDADDATPVLATPVLASDRHRLAAGAAAAILLGVGSALALTALSSQPGENEDMFGDLHRKNESETRALLRTKGPLGYRLTSEGTFCLNRADIVASYIVMVDGVHECYKRCQHDDDCATFAYKDDDTCLLDVLADSDGNCLLWRGACEEVNNTCWNQYALVPREEPHEEPHEKRKLPTPPTNSTQLPTRVLMDKLVSVSFSIKNLDIGVLTSDLDMKQHLHDRLSEAVAEKAGFGITARDVKLELLAGSGVFKASVIRMPDGVDQSKVALNLAPSRDFVMALARGVSEVPNMQSAATGPMNLVMTESSQPREGEESDAPTRAPPSAAPTPVQKSDPQDERDGEEEEDEAEEEAESDAPTQAPSSDSPTPAGETEFEGEKDSWEEEDEEEEEKEEEKHVERNKGRRSDEYIASFDVCGIDVELMMSDQELMASVVAYIKKDVVAQTGVSIMDVNVKVSGD